MNIELILAIIAILGVVLRYVAPILIQKIGKGNLDNVAYWVGVAVMAAEQVYNDRYQGALKKDYVVEFLNKKGLKITEEELDVLIEATVKEINKSGSIWTQ